MRGLAARLLLLPPCLLLLLLHPAPSSPAAAPTTAAASSTSPRSRGGVSSSSRRSRGPLCAFAPPSAWGVVWRRPSGRHGRARVEPRAAGRYTAETFSSDDPLQQDGYWEELFMKGSAAAATVGTAPEGSAAPAAAAAEMGAVGVEVISFDLDDTLWCGKTVIANANKALQAYLEAEHPRLVGDGQPSVASLMGALAKQYPDEFLEDPEDPGSVVRFTDLRKLALSALAQRGGYSAAEAQAVAEAGFKAWHDARHDVDALFFPGVLDLLRRLKGRGARLVAVTNGNCDIAQIGAFEGIFDFCVNAEKVGARKRTGRPYTAAIKRAGLGADVGPRWVHVGDDFTEDIVAAKSDLKLRTVWYHTAERRAKAAREADARQAARREEQQAKAAAAAGTALDAGVGADGGGGAPSLSTLAAMATEGKDRYFKDKGSVHVTATEADDFLTYSIVKEFVDAEVATIEEMAAVLEAWLEEGAVGGATGDGGMGAQQAQAQAPPPEALAVAPASTSSSTSNGGGGVDGETKFCISCREVLPKRAKFCSACGEPQ